MRIWTKPANLALPRSPGGPGMSLTCRFISPVLGGGVEPKQPDPVTWVRASAIRGQLRFWWRATHADLTLDELRARETQLFGGVHGSTPTASAISVHVAKQPSAPRRLEVFLRGNAFKLADERLGALAYGAFPLRGLDPAKTHDALFIYDSPFELTIRIQELEKINVRSELTRALWGWLHFGGLGARTRRGFGAVELVTASGWALESIPKGWPSERRRDPVSWPVLEAHPASVVRARAPAATGREAQEKLLGLLRLMRQGDLGRKPNRPRPGRSYWPEPDAIREIYRMQSGKHGTPIHSPPIPKFPRAAFGAPIIFYFKTEPGEREPAETTLVPARHVVENGEKVLKPWGRLSSSLLLRPHAAGGGGFEAMAVRLAHPAPDGWVLLEKKIPKKTVKTDLQPTEASRITPLVLPGGNSHGDPIAAYLARLAML